VALTGNLFVKCLPRLDLLGCQLKISHIDSVAIGSKEMTRRRSTEFGIVPGQKPLFSAASLERNQPRLIFSSS
jgi:hypothetical protein